MREGKRLFHLAPALALGIALAMPGAAGAQQADAAQAAPQPFRVCADPDNMPFSSAAEGGSGFYIDLGRSLASALGRPFAAVWSQSYFGKRTVRTTLLAGSCDAFIGLPGEAGFMGPQLILSKPFLDLGYVLMLPPGAHVSRLGELAGKRVAVQFSTPPQMLIASHDSIQGVTFLDPDEAAKALARGEVDAALIWGPSAGHLNATALKGAYQVIPIAGDGMQWHATIGFAKANAALRDQVNQVLDREGGAIAERARTYGFPTGVPIDLAEAGAAPAAPTAEASAAAPARQASLVAGPAVGAASAAPIAGDPAKGHEAFNATCSHCHGPDAVQSERRIDLRLLHHRYGDRMDTVFHVTVTHGRPDKGMPNWSGMFPDETFTDILAYLHTVQNP